MTKHTRAQVRLLTQLRLRFRVVIAWVGCLVLATAHLAIPTPTTAYTAECIGEPVEEPTEENDPCIVMTEPVINPAPDLTPITTGPTNNNIPTPTPAEEMVYLVNLLRKDPNRDGNFDDGVPPVKLNTSLMAAAQAFADRMATGNFFSHNDPDFGCNRPWDRMKTAGYTGYRTAAENIAAGYNSAEAGLKAFEDSPAHYATMINANLREVGVGLKMDTNDSNNVRLITACPNYQNTSGPYMFYWVQDYGSRWATGQPVLPIIINDEAFTTTSRQVTLYIYGGESSSSQWAKSMRFSTDNTTWTAYEPWQVTKSFTLPAGAGYKTVYVQLKNTAPATTVRPKR
ncbi:MAG: CAP domain-containing protein [Anaerolineae bacterium]|nr:CAP domain-containing protein [Anaerolineae bacterium]